MIASFSTPAHEAPLSDADLHAPVEVRVDEVQPRVVITAFTNQVSGQPGPEPGARARLVITVDLSR